MEIVAGLSLKNLEPRVWDEQSPYYLPNLRAVMVSYGEFHQMPARRRQAKKQGLHKYLNVPNHVRVFLDNGAFYFLRQGSKTDRRAYCDFVRRAAPNWYPIPFDSIPTPQMTRRQQRKCYCDTMAVNRAYHYDGYVPVMHVSRLLDKYIEAFQTGKSLTKKSGLALGGMVPNLLRSPNAISYADVLATLKKVRQEFSDKELHVFGIGGTATLHLAALLGMDSVDSSGWRNRAARGIIQLPGSGDRMIAKFGSWRGRVPSREERKVLEKCQCPACEQDGLAGLKKDGLAGFCNRATHNLFILLEEAKWIDNHLQDKTYKRAYKKRLNNSAYLRLIEMALAIRET
ncbi:MAG TPA: hypothetical protein VGQ99_06140 [Tepidisphaeraceae bacterium]|nr:hypothetical protein [Tepidisphaeraceae bacterium]